MKATRIYCIYREPAMNAGRNCPIGKECKG